MIKEEIASSKITKAIYINDKWKVTVKLNDGYYSFNIVASGDITDVELSDLIYNKLLSIDVYVIPVVVDVKENTKIIGTEPRELL